jgi:hypothetical protein
LSDPQTLAGMTQTPAFGGALAGVGFAERTDRGLRRRLLPLGLQ